MAESRRYGLGDQLDIEQKLIEAQQRWLRPAEICEILRNYKNVGIAPQPANMPASGSHFLYDRNVQRYFRKDCHNWRKKKDGKMEKENHVRLKVGGRYVLNCYYAYGEENRNFQRRCYWMIDEISHIALVHYREVKTSEGKWPLDRDVHMESEQDVNRVNVLNCLEPCLAHTDKQENFPMQDNHQGQLSNAEQGYYLDSGKTNISFARKPLLDGSLTEEKGLKELDSSNRWMSKDLGDINESDMQSSSGAAFWDGVEDFAPEHLDDYTLEPSVSQDQLFSIIKFSPIWAYEGSEIKVLITGRFLKNQQEAENCEWSCMFGEVEVPAEVIADGVLQCHTPIHKAERVPFYVTRSNRLACSEVREFEYRVKPFEMRFENPLCLSEDYEWHHQMLMLASEMDPKEGDTENQCRGQLNVLAETEKTKTCKGKWPLDRDVHMELEQDVNRVNVLNCLEPCLAHTDKQENFPMQDNHQGQLSNAEQGYYLDLGKTNISFARKPLLDGSLTEEKGLKELDSSNRWMSKDLGDINESDMQSSSGAAFWDGVEDFAPEHLDDYTLEPSISQDQLFSIIKFSPIWAYEGSEIKVLITGRFLKNQQEAENCEWSCMFGEVEVPAEVIADGVLQCHTPIQKAERVPFYVTRSNRLACSEVREFEYRVKPFEMRFENPLCLSSACSPNSDYISLTEAYEWHHQRLILASKMDTKEGDTENQCIGQLNVLVETEKTKTSEGKWPLDRDVHMESEQNVNRVNVLNCLEPYLAHTDKQENFPMQDNHQGQLSNVEQGYYLDSGKTNISFARKPLLDGSLTEEKDLKELDSSNRWMSKDLGDINESDMQSSSGAAFWDGVENFAPEHLADYTLEPSVSQDQLFSIIKFSPIWAYEGSEIKVLITGRFLKNQQEAENCEWSCMFGEVEVPAEVIADGVLQCHTPIQKAERVPFYVTRSNRLACSEVREFEYRVKPFEMRFEKPLCLSSTCSPNSDYISMSEDYEWHHQMLMLASEMDTKEGDTENQCRGQLNVLVETEKTKTSEGKWPLDRDVHMELEQDVNWVNVLNCLEPCLSHTDKQENFPMQDNHQGQLSNAEQGYYLDLGKTNTSFARKPLLDGSLTEEKGLKELDSSNRWMSKDLGDINEPDMQSSSGAAFWDGVEDFALEHLDDYTLEPSVSQDQLFSIIKFSPIWAYEGSEIKVLITGRFLKNQQEAENCEWSCMFGEVEVPAEVIADGVLQCHTPIQKQALTFDDAIHNPHSD